MDVSENSGTPKSSTLMGFSIINHPLWGTTIFGNTQIFWDISLMQNHHLGDSQPASQACLHHWTFSDSLLWKVYPPPPKSNMAGWTNYHVLTGDTSSKMLVSCIVMFVLGRVIGREFILQIHKSWGWPLLGSRIWAMKKTAYYMLFDRLL